MKFCSYTCDNCGAAKREANHWFVVVGFSDDGVLRVSKWSESQANAEPVLHICGELCLATVVGNFANGKELVQKPARPTCGALPSRAATVNGGVFRFTG